MEFCKKLKELRKSRGLTQEELAELLFVSRTAVSKWESGRGYPSVDSLKDISSFFSVSIDELLSGERLLSLAEKENRDDIKSMCEWFSGASDLFSLLLIVLPLYPDTIDGFVYSVNLFSYKEISQLNLIFYWVLFISLLLSGIMKLIFTKLKAEKCNKILTGISLSVNVTAVLFLALAREAYGVVIAFLILAMKVLILLKAVKTGR